MACGLDEKKQEAYWKIVVRMRGGAIEYLAALKRGRSVLKIEVCMYVGAISAPPSKAQEKIKHCGVHERCPAQVHGVLVTRP